MSSGSDVIRGFLPSSPFAAHLGLQIEDLGDGRATLRLPWAPHLATIGDVIHGGAIATLADCAVMAAAWAGIEAPPEIRGVTVGLTIEYLDAARAEDLLAHARVLRRGRSLAACEVDVTAPGDRLVAKALASYKVG